MKKMKKFVVAYVPVLHEGYLKLFRKHAEAKIYIFGDDIIEQFDYLRKEIRALSPQDMKLAIQGLGLFEEVNVLNFSLVKHIGNAKNIVLVMPKEDVTKEIAKRYFKKHTIVWEDIFLRWDRNNSLSQHEISPDIVISEDAFYKKVMDDLEILKEKSSDWWRQVGGCLFREKKFLLRAWNKHVPSPHVPYAEGDPRNNFKKGMHIDLSTAEHAESALVGEAARRGIPLFGCSLYITTFPCPPCAKLIARAGIKKLFYREGYSMLDGERILKQKGVEIIFVAKTPVALSDRG